MTRLAVQDEKISLHDFLTLEMNAPQDERWELIGGVIWRMMAGGTRRHNLIVQNITQRCRDKLRAAGSKCRPYSENLMMIAQDIELAAYPDVVIDCGTAGLESSKISNPAVLFEVLSPGTRTKDLHSKAPRYRQVESVDTIVFLEQDAISVEVHQRTKNGFILSTFTSLDAIVELPALGVSLSLAEIYYEAF